MQNLRSPKNAIRGTRRVYTNTNYIFVVNFDLDINQTYKIFGLPSHGNIVRTQEDQCSSSVKFKPNKVRDEEFVSCML